MPPDLIVALRHGEKPADAEDPEKPLDGTGPGLDAEGQESRSSLTLTGWQRAGGLAGTQLCGTLNATDPVTIAVPRYDQTKRHRAYQTVDALAGKLGQTPQDWVSADEVDALVERALDTEGTLVVCWEHDALSRFAKRVSDQAPEDWPRGRFDVLWIFDRLPAGTGYSWRQAAQRLLPGDQV